MKKGEFREYLYYRLSVIELHIPPLRDRRDDIPLLSEFFLSQFIEEHNLSPKQFSEECMNCLFNYDWPGNVRELRNVIERCVIMSTEEIIEKEDLPKSFGIHDTFGSEYKNGHSEGEGEGQDIFKIPIGTSMENAERIIINQTLSYTENNISEAARILGVSRNTLHNKISKFNEL
jgi:DNA-binding NtrC family response regulator